MKKDLKYYMNLPYKIEIRAIPKAEGGGYVARLPELGRFTLAGDGDTPEEAIRSLNEIKEIMFNEWLEQGISIPEPEAEQHDIEEFSGKFVIRIPKYLHCNLSSYARKNGVSLNQLVATLLAEALERKRHVSLFREILTEIKKIKKCVFKIDSKTDPELNMEIGSLPLMDTVEGNEYSKAA